MAGVARHRASDSSAGESGDVTGLDLVTDSNELEPMNVFEVAEYLRIPRGSIYKLAQRGRIPCQKVGRHWRFRREAVDTWLDSAQSSSGAHTTGNPGE